MKNKKRTMLKSVILEMVAILLIALAIAGCEQSQKDDIYSKMRVVFSEDNIKLSDEAYIKNSHDKEQNSVGLLEFSDFEYNDTIYCSTAYSVDESLLDSSRNIGEVHRADDTSSTRQAYAIKNVNSEYMLAVEVDETYVLYYNQKCSHENLQEYIELIGDRENLDVSYVKVELLNNGLTEKEYIYCDDIEEWVWQLLTQSEHKMLNKVSRIKEDSDSENRIDFVICIRNKYTGAEYLIELLENGNLAISDVYSMYEHEYEYEFSEDELLEALTELAENYEAYEVK